MAVDFAQTEATAEMARSLKSREFPDFMQRVDKPIVEVRLDLVNSLNHKSTSKEPLLRWIVPTISIVVKLHTCKF
ncbi:hypothetical protein QQP08_012420 [Theobroma cacao]|nr:hypothetical protein QQP08_012420 [Theobroma cacao]